MAKLIYSVIASLDGYISDATGNFDWAAPDEEVHRFVNENERPIGTYLFGRRMYETMVYWETANDEASQAPYILDYARIWQGADKVVYSTTLADVTSAKTRIEPSFDPNAVRELKRSSDRDLSIGGPGLAAHAIAAGLVDEFRLYVTPMVVGGGTRALPGNVRVALDLLAEHRFGNGTVYLRYQRRPKRRSTGATGAGAR